MEWLPRLYEQHKDWPGLTSWVFVEAADRVYAECSPDRVSSEGLSVDGTSEFLGELVKKDSRVVYVPHGFTGHVEPDQGKCAARQRYLDIAESVKPDFVFVVDADEFYTFLDQKRIQDIMEADGMHTSFCFPHTHPWRPPSIAKTRSLFHYRVNGALWKIGFVRGWRWFPSVCYRANHNHVENLQGVSLCKHIGKFEGMLDFRGDDRAPHCVHMGFTASLEDRKAKHLYYAARGEGQGDGREGHVECRELFLVWKEGDPLPQRAKVSPYKGPVPECFQ
jgi:hypothetical protein